MRSEGPLEHLIYTSAALQDFSPSALALLLAKARVHNGQHGLTGMLLYHDRSFFQVLEGPPAEVAALYRRLEKDPRHDKLRKIVAEPIERRDFAQWTMGHPELRPEQIARYPGLNDFFQRGACFWDLEPGRARDLLRSFKQGQWHAADGR